MEAPAQVEKNKDNILPRVMAVSGSYDKLFAEELRKYDPLKVGFSKGRTSSACLRDDGRACGI